MTTERQVLEQVEEQAERILNSNRVVVFGSNSSCMDYLPNLRKDLDELGLTELNIRQEKDIYYLPEGFYGNYQTEQNPNPNKTLPFGVILLPEMRQYHDMTGMFVPTYESDVPGIVRKMCKQNHVTLVEIYPGYTQEEVKIQLQKLKP